MVSDWKLRTYAAVTPARDEAQRLPRLFEALAAQRVVPLKWIVVDNGSSDGTADYVSELQRAHPWVRPVPIHGLIFDVATGSLTEVT